MVNKVIKSVAVDPEVVAKSVTKAQFYGYRSLSDLVENLLRRWNESPERKP